MQRIVVNESKKYIRAAEDTCPVTRHEAQSCERHSDQVLCMGCVR
jgi:hypothetical protein